MQKHSRIYVAGHRGLAGSAIVRRLRYEGYGNIVTRGRESLDLTRQADVESFFDAERPEYVFLAAARVGGILANSRYPADFIRDNLLIQTLLIEAARRSGVRKLLFLGSSCIYPKHAPQPVREECLLTGPLEPTNEAYAAAKIAGVKTVEAYREQYGFDGVSLMPSNLYGPGDNFDLETGHVLPALIRKFHDAKASGADTVTVWGSGKPRREFLHADDLAEAAIFVMNRNSSPGILNVGCGQDCSIRELAGLIREITGFEGRILFDETKPDGTPRKLLDVSRITGLGWNARIGLREGIESVYGWFLGNAASAARLASSERIQ